MLFDMDSKSSALPRRDPAGDIRLERRSAPPKLTGGGSSDASDAGFLLLDVDCCLLLPLRVSGEAGDADAGAGGFVLSVAAVTDADGSSFVTAFGLTTCCGLCCSLSMAISSTSSPNAAPKLKFTADLDGPAAAPSADEPAAAGAAVEPLTCNRLLRRRIVPRW